MANLEIHKKIRKPINKNGVQRFITASILLFVGLIWLFFGASGAGNSGLTLQSVSTFLPIWGLAITFRNLSIFTALHENLKRTFVQVKVHSYHHALDLVELEKLYNQVPSDSI